MRYLPLKLLYILFFQIICTTCVLHANNTIFSNITINENSNNKAFRKEKNKDNNKAAPIQVVASNDVTICYGDMQTQISAEVSGGSGTYSIDWTPAAHLSNPNKLITLAMPTETTTFTITVKDADGTVATDNVTITVKADATCPCNPPVVDGVNVVSANCSKSDGSAHITLWGGASNANFVWTPNVGIATGNGEGRKNLPPGTYNVDIAYSFNPNCKITQKVVVPNINNCDDGTRNSDCGTMKKSHSSTPACGTNGSITFDVVGGDPPIIYDWLDLYGTSDSKNRNTIPAGTYYVLASDNIGCLVRDTIVVPPCDIISPTCNDFKLQISSQDLCNSTLGSITLSVTGGYPPYTYDWADLSGADNPASRTNLPVGSYSVVVTDSKYCKIVTKSISIKVCDAGYRSPGDCSLFKPAFKISDVCGSVLGSAYVTDIPGGTPPYNYDWADIVGSNDTKDRPQLAKGDYFVTITDSNNCQSITSIAISECVLLLPHAGNDQFSILSGASKTIDVMANDTINGKLVDMSIVQSSLQGRATPSDDHKIIYTANEKCPIIDTIYYRISNGNGADTAKVLVTVNCSGLKIVNGFSPNNDGINDTFSIYGIENYPANGIVIYNRWGNKVYQMYKYSNDKPWDGSFDGSILPDGTYFYVLELHDENLSVYSGYVQINR